jgi:uncharacterized repeat protein (TIGR03806 family)
MLSLCCAVTIIARLPNHAVTADVGARYAGRQRARLSVLVMLIALSAGCSDQRLQSSQYFAVDNPKKLSQWSVIQANDQDLSLAVDAQVYQLASPLFSDYAGKLRTLSLPAGGQVALDADTDRFRYPVGTIITKTFYYRRASGSQRSEFRLVKANQGSELGLNDFSLAEVTLLETRVLVKRAGGWTALPYVWDADQQDATLSPAGALIRASLQSEGESEGEGPSEEAQAFAYLVPNQNQCAGCHVLDQATKAILPIGPHPRHLATGVEAGDQLAAWAAFGALSDGVLQEAVGLGANVDWRDAKRPLYLRARSYLDINCGHCHSPTGPADTSGMFLTATSQDPIRWGVCKAPIAAGQGTGGAQFGIVPGNPDASILSYRLGSTDPGAMMPELGRSLVHAEGLALIRAWIAEMPGQCDEAQQTVAHSEGNNSSLLDENLAFTLAGDLD